MTDWRSLRGSNFLSPEDLESGPALITIVAVSGEEMLDDDEKVKKEVAVTIKAHHRNPQTGQLEDLPKTEWVANVINLTLLEALFGTPHVEEWVGRKALVQQEPCEVPGKYLGKPSVRVCGGPEITADLPVEVVLRAKGGKKRRPIHKVLVPTRRSNAAASVDPVTGEVGSPPVAAQQPASAPPSDPATPAPSDQESAQDGEIGEEADELDLMLGDVAPIRPPAVTQAQLATIQRLIKSTGIYEAELAGILDSYGALEPRDLSKQNADYVIQALKERQT